MSSIKDWQQEAEKLDPCTLAIIRTALENLLEWDFFEAAYRETGLGTVKSIVRHVYAEKVHKIRMSVRRKG
ncbi:hypothetical protein KAR91_56290 [Candidatus Pacearchaeota archaeon]|nr:hypothetical protein [Candidatus Pacearchaeota archaeon]